MRVIQIVLIVSRNEEASIVALLSVVVLSSVTINRKQPLPVTARDVCWREKTITQTVTNASLLPIILHNCKELRDKVRFLPHTFTTTLKIPTSHPLRSNVTYR